MRTLRVKKLKHSGAANSAARGNNSQNCGSTGSQNCGSCSRCSGGCSK